MSRFACALVSMAIFSCVQSRTVAQNDDPFGDSVRPATSAASPVATHSVTIEKPKLRQGNDGKAEERIAAELRKTTTIEFVETPLSDVVEYLKDLHKFEIQLDSRALEDAGAGADTPINKNLKGISLDSALRLMLEPLDLTYVIQNEVLLITTREKADSMMEIKVYDVTDLANPSTDATSTKLQSLAKVIQSTAFPHTWKAEGGPGRLEALTLDSKSTLVVAQTARAHEEISSLLIKLRRAKDTK